MTPRKRPPTDTQDPPEELTDKFKSTDYKDDGKCLDTTNFLQTNTITSLVTFLNRNIQIVSLKINFIHLNEEDISTLTTMLHVKALTLYGCYLKRKAINQFSLNSTLTHLDLSSYIDDKYETLEFNSNLVSLELGDTSISYHSFPELPHLTYLSAWLSLLNLPNNLPVLDSIANCTALKTLIFKSHQNQNGPEIYPANFTKLTRLKSLELPKFSTARTLEILSKMTSLTSLKLETVSTLEPLINNQNLFRFNCARYRNIDERTIIHQYKQCVAATKNNGYREDLWFLNQTINLIMGRKYSPTSPFRFIPEEIAIIILLYLADKTCRSEQQVKRIYNLTKSNISQRSTQRHSFWKTSVVETVKEGTVEKKKGITVFRAWEP